MSRIAPLTDDERVRFIAAARARVETPFRHTGRNERGVDCIGLVILALGEVGRVVDDRRDYGRNPVRDGLREACVAHLGDPVPLADMRAGDVALMAWRDVIRNAEVNHVAVLFDHPNGGLAMVHALAQNKRVIAHRVDDVWRGRIVEVFRP